MRQTWRRGYALAATLFAILTGNPVGADCLDEAGIAALERSGFGGEWQPFLDEEMPSGDYGYEVRQQGDSFFVRAFRPNFLLWYVIGLNGDDALIAARYTTYDISDDNSDPGSYMIYYNGSRRDHILLCGGKEPGAMVLTPVLSILDDLRKRVPE